MSIIPEPDTFTICLTTIDNNHMVTRGKMFTSTPSFNIFRHHPELILKEAERQTEVDSIDSIEDLFCF